MEYYEENTYLIFDKKTDQPIRYNSSGDLNYYNCLKDAVKQFNSSFQEIKSISECSEELQKEYRKLIDNIL